MKFQVWWRYDHQKVTMTHNSWLSINSKIHSRGENSIETFWFASALVAVISQLYDVTYFEGRVSILIWILLAGLKSITDNNLQTSKRFL